MRVGGNPAPKGAAKREALRAAFERRQRVMHEGGGGGSTRKTRAIHDAAVRRGAASVLRRNPLAGLVAGNPRRRRNAKKKGPHHMARRSAKQRAAFRRMQAGLRRYKQGLARAGKPKRRRRRRLHNPRRAHARRRHITHPNKGAHMARRRRRRRRNPARVMVNPRRKHRRRRNPRRAFRRHHRRHGGHHRFRRRRNPAGLGMFFKDFLKVSIPSLLIPGVVGFAQAKLMSGMSAPAQYGAKVGLAAVGGYMLRKRPLLSVSLMASIMGTIGFTQGVRAGGGVVAVGPKDAQKALAALVREDPRAMGVLVQQVRRMGAQIDDRVSLSGQELASTALPGAQYQDVKLS